MGVIVGDDLAGFRRLEPRLIYDESMRIHHAVEWPRTYSTRTVIPMSGETTGSDVLSIAQGQSALV